MKFCPRCGQLNMRDVDVENALSRRCDKYICSDCGNEEAMEDAGFILKLPIDLWACNKKN